MVRCDACGAERPEAMVRSLMYAGKNYNVCNECYVIVAVNPAKYLKQKMTNCGMRQ